MRFIYFLVINADTSDGEDSGKKSIVVMNQLADFGM